MPNDNVHTEPNALKYSTIPKGRNIKNARYSVQSCKNVYILWDQKNRSVVMGCNRIAKYQPAICKDYYEAGKNVNSCVAIHKKNL